MEVRFHPACSSASWELPDTMQLAGLRKGKGAGRGKRCCNFLVCTEPECFPFQLNMKSHGLVLRAYEKEDRLKLAACFLPPQLCRIGICEQLIMKMQLFLCNPELFISYPKPKYTGSSRYFCLKKKCFNL